MNLKVKSTVIHRPAPAGPVKRPKGNHFVEVNGRIWLVVPSLNKGFLVGGDIKPRCDWHLGECSGWHCDEDGSFFPNEKLIDCPVTIELEPA